MEVFVSVSLMLFTCGAAFWLGRRSKSTASSEVKRLKQKMKKQERIHVHRYSHLKTYYMDLALKYNTARRRHKITKDKLYGLVQTHFGSQFVDDVFSKLPTTPQPQSPPKEVSLEVPSDR